MVCTALDRAGATAVLTGGSATTVYVPEAYQSRDLDFVIEFRAVDARPADALAGLGYREEGGVYLHPENPLTLDFPPGPLMVGGDLVDSWETWREGERLLHVLAPTDACRDRLAGFLFWNDRGSLEQALALARGRPGDVDLAAVRNWCEREGHARRYGEFARLLGRKP